MVASGQVDLDSLVTGRFDLERADEALESDLDRNSLKSIVLANGFQDGDYGAAVRLQGRC
jgi:L-iditol 2-dehydrogenase